jgi:hypothetical protein
VDVTLDILLVLSNVTSRVSRYHVRDDQFISQNLRGLLERGVQKMIDQGEPRGPVNPSASLLAIDTGGKGWCPDPVHHKYIARKWTKNLANTHLEYSKDIQNFPS